MRFPIGGMMMLAFAKGLSGMAEETSSPAVIENLFAVPLPMAADAAPKLLPSFDVQRYFIEGNTVLPPADFAMLSNYTGPAMTVARVQEGLGRLQTHYRDLGFSNINVTLPEQKFTNGTVRIQIVEQGTPVGGTDLAAAITNLFTAPKPTFEVRGYRIEGNTALPAEEFNLLTNYLGELDFTQRREGLGRLQLLYRNLGFATIGVTLPQQRLTNGTVRVKIVEGKLSHVT